MSTCQRKLKKNTSKNDQKKKKKKKKTCQKMSIKGHCVKVLHAIVA